MSIQHFRKEFIKQTLLVRFLLYALSSTIRLTASKSSIRNARHKLLRKASGFAAITIVALILGSSAVDAILSLSAHRIVKQVSLSKTGRAEKLEQHQVERKRGQSNKEHKAPDIKFVRVRSGTFTMGSNTGEKNERPTHQIMISRDYELQETEVTQAQWEALMGNNPSHFRGSNQPVETVSWDEVQQFISKLNASNDDYYYRLPTEAEWEYACRAGTTQDFAGNLDEMGFYDKNSGLTTHLVRGKRPNAWGLYDMHGNVWEWVGDWYGKYQGKQVVDPQGPTKGSLRVVRGGGWHSTAEGCRSAFRLGSEPGFRNSALGFRLVRMTRWR